MTKEQKFSDALGVQVERRIFLVHGQKVMLDTDLAELYRVPTKSLNLAVKRNPDRFPEDFMFQLADDEAAGLRLHFETSKRTSLLEIVFLQPRDLHERAKQSLFQRLISVDRNHDPFTSARHGKNVMAALNPSQYPTTPLDNLRKLATGDLLHTVTSST